MGEHRNELRCHWRIALGAFAGVAAGFASLYFYTAGLFIKPLSVEFGWSRGEASLGAMAISVGNIFALPIVGRLIDRYGEIRIASICGLALAIGFALLGMFTVGLTSYLLLVLLLTVGSSGSNAIGYNRIIVRHFTQQRGLALGLALTGTAVGAGLIPPLLMPFIAEHGWRNAYYILSGLTLLLTAIALFLLRAHGKASEPISTTAQHPLDHWTGIYRHPSFLPISLLIFFSSTAVLGSTMHIVPLLTDRGIDLVTAGGIAASLGLSVIIGRLIAGFMLDRWDAGWVTWLLLTLAALGVLALWTGQPALILPGAMLIGFGVGTEGDLLAYLLGRRFPVRNFGSVYGAIFGIHALGAGVGGLLAGTLFDWTGSYDLWLLLASGGLALSGLIALVSERNVKMVS